MNNIEFSIVGADEFRSSLRTTGIMPAKSNGKPASNLPEPPKLRLCDNLSEMFVTLIELPERPDAINPRQFIQYFLHKQAHYPYINFLALIELGREVWPALHC